MDKHTLSEESYKNGYEQGLKDAVKEGEWKNGNNRPKTYIRICSVCGKEAYFCGLGCSYKFCPNCGARMKG